MNRNKMLLSHSITHTRPIVTSIQKQLVTFYFFLANICKCQRTEKGNSDSTLEVFLIAAEFASFPIFLFLVCNSSQLLLRRLG